MKERGKGFKTYTNFPVFNSEFPCNIHPHSSHVGVCPYCLTNKLTKLVCSECGRSRVSSCSCSHSNRNIFDVGRFSFLIENERNNEKVVLFRRSNSSCVGGKKKKGFWKGLFGKKKNRNRDDEVCVSGVSRSVSLSDAGGLFFDSNQMDKDKVCNFQNPSVFSILSPMDGADFIDLNLHSLSKDFLSGVSDHAKNDNGGNVASLKSKWGLWFLQGTKK